MEQAELERQRQRFDSEVRSRFTGTAIERVEILQYGDDPSIEPGEFLGRVILDGSGITTTGEAAEEDRGKQLEDFHQAHREAVRELRRELDKMSTAVVLEILVGGEAEDGLRGRPRLKLVSRGRGLGGGGGDVPFTPVMARLGPEDLETLDTLITSGIAPSRAEAVRWAIARIRERPAYEQLRARSREIEELKGQF